MMQYVRKYGVVGMVLWACSSKKVSFVILLVQLGLVWFSRVTRASRLSKVRVGIRVSIRVRVS